jgi:hypothetical protein
MLMILIGVVTLVVTVVLFRWGVPKDGQPSRVPNKWGLGTMFPIALMCLGLSGLVLVLKGIFP